MTVNHKSVNYIPSVPVPSLRLRVALYSIIPIVLLLLAIWSTVRPVRAESLDVACSTQALTASILNANANALIDTLTLAPNCVYEYTEEYEDSTALPRIRNKLTIEGNGATIQRAPNAEPFRLFYIDNATAVTLRNMTISNGLIPNNRAGAILAKYGDRNTNTVTLDRVTVENSRAATGGALFTEVGNLIIKNQSRFVNNEATGTGGGAIDTYFGTQVFIQNSHFEGNETAGSGGALFSTEEVRLENSTFVDNQAALKGGAVMLIQQGTMRAQGGRFAGNQAGTEGGAIHISQALELSGVQFTDNSAGEAGGAIFAPKGLTGNGLSFARNRQTLVDSDSYGGGAIASGDNTSLTQSAFSNNEGYIGGALWLNAPTDTLTVRAGQFLNNKALKSGGAIYTNGSLIMQQSSLIQNQADECGAVHTTDDTTIELTTFTSNTADGDLAQGGAACLFSGRANLTKNTFQNNQAGSAGGAVFSLAQTTNIAESAFRQNIAADTNNDPNQFEAPRGGAIFAGGRLLLTKNTFEQNEAGNGGAVFSRSMFEFQQNRFVRNRAQKGGAYYSQDITCGPGEHAGNMINNLWIENDTESQGAAVYFRATTGVDVALLHETFIGPQGGQSPNSAIYVASGILAIRNSIITNHRIGIEVGDGELLAGHNLYYGNDENIKPEVEELNALTADPRFINAASGDYRLRPDSPAINSAELSQLGRDHDDNLRPIGAGSDRGAFEYQGADPTATPEPTATSVSPTATPEPTATATNVPPTPGLTTTVQPTATPESTATPGTTATPQPTATVTPPTTTPTAPTEPTATAEPTGPNPPTATPTVPLPEPTPDSSATPQPTETVNSPTPTQVAPTGTVTPAPSETVVPTPVLEPTPVAEQPNEVPDGGPGDVVDELPNQGQPGGVGETSEQTFLPMIQ